MKSVDISESVIIDSRLKSKIENLTEWGNEEIETSYSLKFKDIDDVFWFSDINELQEFLNNQTKERFYDKQLRKGYFDYMNEHGEMLRYYINVNRGSVSIVKDMCIS